MIQKTNWRRELLIQRNNLSPRRRELAARSLLEKFKGREAVAELHESGKSMILAIGSRGKLLSFNSFGSEIDTSLLNAHLALRGRLFLPRVEGNSLIPYLVSDLKNDLLLSPLGVWEPDPLRCPKGDLSEIDAVLVPGLGFDRGRFRLGYGKGFYDRFLSQGGIHSIGVGFIEQSIDGDLPRSSWDLPVNELFLT